jgi:Tol biopolymer transport system component
LYITDKGQIVRIEVDGKTTSQITNEPSEGDALVVTQFAVSPKGAPIVYVVQQGSEQTLVRIDADGTNRVELFKEAGASISYPVWSPSGEQIAASIVRSNPDGTNRQGGVYLIPATGGEPLLVQPDDPITEPTAGEQLAYGHSVRSWSPDGSSLLLNRFALQVEGCELSIRLFDQDKVTLPVPPSDTVGVNCGPTAWSTDSKSVYLTYVPKDNMYQQGAGLWRVDVASGESTEVVPSEIDGKTPVVRGPMETQAGSILAFVALADGLPAMFDEGQSPEYHLSRIDTATGSITELRPETYTNIGDVLWAPDGSGVVVQLPTEQGFFGLTWLPADGSAPVQLSNSPDVYGFAWGV